MAILDATNVSRARRRLMEGTLTDHPLLFIECRNEDQELLRACIRRKTALPEYAGYTEEAALENFNKRIGYYEHIYEPLRHEKFWLRVDSTANRILAEHPREGCAYYPAIREIVVSVWVHCLYLVRHGQTEFNLQGRIGGDPPLTTQGEAQAAALAEHLRDRPIHWVFTSTRQRSHQTAAPLAGAAPPDPRHGLSRFDEIWAGDCEGLRYAEIRQRMPRGQRPQCRQIRLCLPQWRKLRHAPRPRPTRFAPAPFSSPETRPWSLWGTRPSTACSWPFSCASAKKTSPISMCRRTNTTTYPSRPAARFLNVCRIQPDRGSGEEDFAGEDEG